jgi:pimeloyl-ACP methyl ester carboxylesterase/aryl carrier-like protein
MASAAPPDEPMKLPAEITRDGLAAYLKSCVQRLLATPDEIAEDRNLIELGLDSLMIMDLINDLKRSFPLNLYPRELYAFPTIGALSDYLLGEIRGTRSGESGGHGPAFASIELAVPAPTPIENKVPGVVFVLSSPRAGSTLLRVMLAGHSGLFCPPELHLLPFETMGARREKLGLSFLGEGLERALMELSSVDAAQSKELTGQWADDDERIHEIYRRLHELAAPRILVDKSPMYAGSLDTLRRAEALFADAKYIHLVRHPYSVIESFVRTRMGKIIGASDEDPHTVAERIWSASNANILEFLKDVGPGRCHRIVYEDLVQSPEATLRACCDFLGLSFEEGMLTPYEGQRMTDGVRSQSLSIGDPNFLNHKTIDPALSDVWKKIQLPRTLGPDTRRLAAEFDYSLPREADLRRVEDTLEVRGMPFAVCSWGPADGPVVFCLHGILEHGAAWELVALDLARRGFRVIAPDQRGHGRSGHASAGTGYYLMDFVADADALTAALGDRPFTLVGHSMGAAVSSLLMAARPARVGSLILVECILPNESEASDAGAELSSHLGYLSVPVEHPSLGSLAVAASRLRAGTPSMSESFAEQMAERLTEPRGAGVAWRWDARLRSRAGIAFDGMGTMSRARYLRLLADIRSPITFVYGNESRYTGEGQAALLQRLLPGSHAVTLAGGHNLHTDSPAELAAAIAAHACADVAVRSVYP